MRVSAIIPSLGKRPEMLAEAVASIKAQTYPVLDIQVMDYPDDSEGNQARRLNEGVKKSKGDWYFFMGDDDILEPNFVEVLVGTINDDSWDIITSWFRTFGDENGVHGPGPFPLCSTIVKREMYDKTNGYDEYIPIGIDADFYFQCFEQGAQWKIIPDVLYNSRVHKDQYSLIGDWSQYHPRLKEKYNGKYSNV